VTSPVDLSLAMAACPRCNTRFATEQAIAGQPSYRPYEARWMLAPLLGIFAVAFGLIGISQLVAFFVWAAGSAATLAVGSWHAMASQRVKSPPRPSLPSAIAAPRGERRRALPPASPEPRTGTTPP
jgi:hypothetical protein